VGSGDLLLRAKNAKVDGAIEPAQLETYAGNKKEAKNLARQYDFFLADTALMPRIGRILGQFLGPRGKIPQAVPPNAQIEAMINRTRSAVRVRSRGTLGVSGLVGDKKLSDPEIADNILAVIQAVQKKLPNGDKNIRTVGVKTSMGKLVKGKVEES
jgi:large subunit ribosomal protein L1